MKSIMCLQVVLMKLKIQLALFILHWLTVKKVDKSHKFFSNEVTFFNLASKFVVIPLIGRPTNT